MINIEKLKQQDNRIVTLGSHPKIIQSILDFDYLAAKKEPSVKAIVAAGRNFERYFFGKKEVLIPVFKSLKHLSGDRDSLNLALNVVSGRRVKDASLEALDSLPNLEGIVIFAEEVPEMHALEIWNKYKKAGKFAIGPASVGLLIPKVLKLGAIGGVDATQITDSNLMTQGSVAVFSASGGMTNEIIRVVAQAGHALSFALAFGGERFPCTTPRDAFEAAIADPNTRAIVYFGELGGQDEYGIAKLLEESKTDKKIICYIAGIISSYFEEPPQFGHAKALAGKKEETAEAKREALKAAGATVPDSFTDFVKEIQNIGETVAFDTKSSTIALEMTDRKHALIASSIARDVDGNPTVLGQDLLPFAKDNSFGKVSLSMFLGREIKSQDTEDFANFVLKLLVDHGPYVSGALNSIVTARAGRDLPSSLATGILTVGPRFGGAINEAAATWLTGVREGKKAADLVEEFAAQKKYISGIGHRKYRVDMPDPRVIEITKYAEGLNDPKYTKLAREVEKVTVAKKGNLILNVDGAIAAVLLDLLAEKEGYTEDELQKLVDIEFFNAIFIASRSVGFLAHALDQKRLDEGLLRLEDSDVAEATS